MVSLRCFLSGAVRLIATTPRPLPLTLLHLTPLPGKKIVTASEDSMLILWDPRTGEAIHKLTGQDTRFRLEGGINCLAVNPTSTVAIVGGAEGGLRAVNLVQGTVLAQMEGHEEGASIEQVAFNEIPTVSTGGGAAASSGPSVTVMVSVGTDGRVCTWEASGFRLRSSGAHEVRLPFFFFRQAGISREQGLLWSWNENVSKRSWL